MKGHITLPSLPMLPRSIDVRQCRESELGREHQRGLLRSHEGKLTAIQRMVDAAWIAGALLLANRLYPQGWDAEDTIAASVAVTLFVLASEATGLYRSWRGTPLHREILQIVLTWTVVLPILLFIAFVSKTSAEFSRQVVLTWFALAPALLAVWRSTARIGLQELRKRGRNTRSVAILGASDSGYALARTILEQPWTGMRLAGIYDDRHALRCPVIPEDLPVDRIAGTSAALLELAKHGEIDLIYIALPLKAEELINSLLRALADTTASVYLVADSSCSISGGPSGDAWATYRS